MLIAVLASMNTLLFIQVYPQLKNTPKLLFPTLNAVLHTTSFTLFSTPSFHMIQPLTSSLVCFQIYIIILYIIQKTSFIADTFTPAKLYDLIFVLYSAATRACV